MADCVFICLDCSEVHMNENSQCPMCHSTNLQKYATNGSTTPVSPKSITKIIVVACSARKDFPQKEIPALKAYASSYPQEIKEIFQKYGKPEGLGVFILSAKYGLIHENYPIHNYDQMMTPQQAATLKDQVNLSSTGILKSNPQIDEIFLLMSKKYYQAIDIKALSKLVKITEINAKYHGLTQRIVTLFQQRFPHWR